MTLGVSCTGSGVELDDPCSPFQLRTVYDSLIIFVSELLGLLRHFKAVSKGRKIDFSFSFEVRIQKEVILNLST